MPTSIIGDGTKIEEEFGSDWYQEKIRGLWRYATILYLDEDAKQDEGLWDRVWRMMGGCKGIFYKGIGKKHGLT